VTKRLDNAAYQDVAPKSSRALLKFLIPGPLGERTCKAPRLATAPAIVNAIYDASGSGFFKFCEKGDDPEA
jgi:hypothetical protein